MVNRRFVIMVVLMTLVAGGCRGLGQTPPPPPYDVDSLATAIVLTENAPPAGYESAAVPVVDADLADLPGYRYTLDIRFEGVYDSDLREAVGHIRAEVLWDGLAPARRVILDAGGDAFAREPRRLEAVRMVDDYYLVDEAGRCLVNVQDTARAVANIDAGSLIGGITETAYSGTQAVLNSVQAYRYDVTAAAAILPLLNTTADSRVDLNGELWLAPASDSVVRYYINATVNHVYLLDNDEAVSGQVFIRYDLFDIGDVPNISIPYGC
jgi:hypothetical protein